jgi:hypothetical protein
LQDEYATPRRDSASAGLTDYATVLVLPVCFAVLSWYLRGQSGPFWQWNLLDPAYFYLLDALNLLNGEPPGHIYHPGVTVQALGALVIKLHWLVAGGGIAEALADPETHLRWMSNAFVVLNALALIVVGVVARLVSGNLIAALVCQLAPFMSTIVIKHAFLPKPESLVVFATLALIAQALLTLNGEMTRQARDRLAIGFGVVAGFTVATKLTAAPMLVLPLFVLRGWRPFMIYAVSSIIAFAVFFAPAHGREMAFFEYIVRLATKTGPHGSGDAGVVVLDTYTQAIVKILKRPSLKVPLIVSAIALLVTWLRARRGGQVAAAEVWLVIGVGAAQLAQTLVVAKQPTAFYMIPSYMLAAVSVLFSIRLLWAAKPERLRLPFEPGVLGAFAFAVFVAAQTAGMERLVNEMSNLRDVAKRVDHDKFKACARIYVYATSAPVYAFYLSNFVSGSRFSEALKPMFPANDYWINGWWQWLPVRLENWSGPQDFNQVRSAYPCLYIRGTRPGAIEKFLSKQPGGTNGFDFSCWAGTEKIALQGIDCQGRRR